MSGPLGRVDGIGPDVTGCGASRQARATSAAMPEERVRLPGIFLMIVAGINVVMVMLQIAYYGFAGTFAATGGMTGDEPLGVVIFLALMVAGAILGVAWNGVIGYAGWRMQRLESYHLAMAGAILAIIPCFSACCLLSMPAGIFALVTLNEGPVKDAFRS